MPRKPKYATPADPPNASVTAAAIKAFLRKHAASHPDAVVMHGDLVDLLRIAVNDYLDYEEAFLGGKNGEPSEVRH